MGKYLNGKYFFLIQFPRIFFSIFGSPPVHDIVQSKVERKIRDGNGAAQGTLAEVKCSGKTKSKAKIKKKLKFIFPSK